MCHQDHFKRFCWYIGLAVPLQSLYMSARDRHPPEMKTQTDNLVQMCGMGVRPSSVSRFTARGTSQQGLDRLYIPGQRPRIEMPGVAPHPRMSDRCRPQHADSKGVWGGMRHNRTQRNCRSAGKTNEHKRTAVLSVGTQTTIMRHSFSMEPPRFNGPSVD